ncbi:hypothetical protein IEU95_10055 [Hoyosella rhizosphaerae]|uniref:BRCT domain-containing protein n=1 Tax=Hoyosella rhizosphaerae TaxID=1755582 RepID=A0A916TZ30_9ACTN|nr:exonuclease domain-containing protein [Hoyosella rhizosphaerae]MBN4927177.1 hypothetical protein [Hoyosella rhizosphaerae]GGC53401.1 hypothetical protein GCM10011410_02190 [Hoyosella rhizosphaerae]
MSHYQTADALVRIENEQVIIWGQRVMQISFGDITAVAASEPRMLGRGRLDIFTADQRHTLTFTRGQLRELNVLAGYLAQIADINSTRQPVCGSANTTGVSFVSFDVETANRARGSICAVGFSVVHNGVITDTRAILCKPPKSLDGFDPGNVRVHGITPNQVRRAIPAREAIGHVLDIAGGLPLVCHNASFDISALRDACVAEALPIPELSFGCTLTWSRKDLSKLQNHKLPTVAAALGVSLENHHDAGADAYATAGILLSLTSKRGSSTLADYTTATKTQLGSLGPAGITACKGTNSTNSSSRTPTGTPRRRPPKPDLRADPTGPLRGQTIVISGEVPGFTRDEAWDAIVAAGATPEDSVTKRCTILVAGDGAGETKLGKMRRLAETGHPIALVDSSEFAELLAGQKIAALPNLAEVREQKLHHAMSLVGDAPAEAIHPSELVRGKHYTAWVEPIKQLKRDELYDEALELLLECVTACEQPESRHRSSPAPWYTEQAAIIYRKRKDFVGEVAILQRWLELVEDGSQRQQLKERFEKAQLLLAREG